MGNEITKTENNTVATTTFNLPTGFICTIDTSTLNGKLLVAQAINGATSMKDIPNGEVLRITNFITTEGTRSRTGEPCTNTYLVTEDGEILFTQSEGIAKSLPIIIGMFVDNEGFHNPVEMGCGMRLVIEELSNGNTLKKLVPVALN